MAPALPPQQSLSDTLPLFVRTRHGHAFARRAMPSSKADETWTEPEGVVCRLYNSGLVKFGVNLGCPKDMVPSTKRMLAKSAVEAVRTHKDIAFLAAYAASVASAQPMWPSESTYAGVGQRELRGLQAAQTSAPQSWSSARACSQIHALAELSSWRLQVAEPRLAERRSARRELRSSHPVCLVCLSPACLVSCLSVCLSVCLCDSAVVDTWMDRLHKRTAKPVRIRCVCIRECSWTCSRTPSAPTRASGL